MGKNHDNASVVLMDINEVRIFRQVQILLGVNGHSKLAIEMKISVSFVKYLRFIATHAHLLIYLLWLLLNCKGRVE